MWTTQTTSFDTFERHCHYWCWKNIAWCLNEQDFTVLGLITWWTATVNCEDPVAFISPVFVVVICGFTHILKKLHLKMGDFSGSYVDINQTNKYWTEKLTTKQTSFIQGDRYQGKRKVESLLTFAALLQPNNRDP